SLLPKNKSKNRFKNILPYDHTRVVLSDDGDGNDYINACYIDCHSVPRKYIATQGPLAKTEGDFWRMMWETKSSIIIMLTNLFENGKKKCQKYWPDFGAQRDFKQINVACTQEEVIGCFVKRIFTIKLPEVSQGAHDVTQFHYTTWPDHNIPITTTGLHRLKHAVMEQHKKSGESKPIVVHCSAGAGRTGTFIAFDSLSMQMNDRPSINVFDTVVNLRMQRMDMVQTPNQYMFLHKLVAEVYMLGQTDIPVMSLESKTKELERFDVGWDSTCLFRGYKHCQPARLHKGQTTFALLPKNKSKNRFKNILPYDHTRVVLSNDGDGNDYINACYIDCPSVPRKYIATQGPLAKTEGDFWRMMWETKSSIIVMLTNLFENGKKKCQKYWPDFGTQRDFKQINVVCTQEEVIGCFVKRTFRIKLPEGAHDVTQFHYTTWPDHNIPITTTGLHRLKQAVMEQHKKSGESKPIVVHCSDGAGRTGAFLCILNLVERAKLEGRVDVLREVKDMRDMRVGMLQSKLLYRFVYYCMAEFVSTFDVYAN
uniref:Tyrosine-protein phosphatase non-receptor type 20 n=1 Tax=Ciona savignyi TaxID=51511 RepID=H2YNA9_CIOSA